MSHNSTKLQVPVNVADPIVLRRFLGSLVQQLDIVFGHRGNTPYVSSADLSATSNDLLAALSETSGLLAQALLAVAQEEANAAEEAAKAYADANFTNNPEQAAIVDLTYTAVVPSAAYVQAEATQVANDVKTHADKIDVILAALRASDIIA